LFSTSYFFGSHPISAEAAHFHTAVIMLKLRIAFLAWLLALAIVIERAIANHARSALA